MDHIRAINKIRSKEHIKRAFNYAIYDRLNSDHYFDYFEIEYVTKNKDKIIKEILDELSTIENYEQRIAYAYYPPKTDLCFRRMIYLPFKYLVIRYAVVTLIADEVDDELSESCFANRKAKGEQVKRSLLEDFSKEAWPKFCQWQKEQIENYSVLLKTDISSFYDSVSHEYLVSIIEQELSINSDSEFIKLIRKLLAIPVISYSSFR